MSTVQSRFDALSRMFATATAAGIGATADALSHVDFGQGVYRFVSPNFSMAIFERGMVAQDADTRLEASFADIVSVGLAPLKELARARGPEANVKLRVRVSTGEVALVMPYKVYGAAAPAIAFAVEASAASQK